MTCELTAGEIATASAGEIAAEQYAVRVTSSA